MSLLASRAGYPNWAWQMLDTYANSFITPNTFHINGDPRVFGLSLHTYDPMTLEAGFGAAAAIQEMLLQSQGGLIRVFPSMPDRWHDACFENLRAEGAFLVSAKLVDGALQWVRVTSEAGGRCRIDNAFGAPVLLANAEQKSTELSGDLLEFDTEPGQSYLLYAAAAESAPPDQAPSAFTRSDDELNFYGIKRLPRF
jgi:alpha-L-fucosidase 2